MNSRQVTLIICSIVSISLSLFKILANDEQQYGKEYFAVKINNGIIYINDKESKVISILGKGKTEKIMNMKECGVYSTKMVYYEGISFEYAQIKKDDPYSIITIDISDSRYSMVKRIKIGDSYNRLKYAYKNMTIKSRSTGTGLVIYHFTDYVTYHVEFSLNSKNIITKITIYDEWL